jgi:hypothetical protein
MGPSFFQEVGWNINTILQPRDVLKPYQRNMFLNMQTHVLKSSPLTQIKGQQMDSLLEELFLKTLDV